MYINIVSNNATLIFTTTNNAFRCKASWKQRHIQTHTYLKISPERYFSMVSDFRWTSVGKTPVHLSCYEGVSVKSVFSLLETVQL